MLENDTHDTVDQRRLVPWLGRHRTLVQVTLDLFAWLTAIYASVWFRFEFQLDQWQHSNILIGVAVACGLQIVAGFAFGLYQGRWRFGSFEEVAALARTAAIVGLGLLALSHLLWSPRLLPTSVVVGAAFAALLVMASVRYIWRLVIDRGLRPSADRSIPVIVFGAGEGGCQLVSTMLRNPDSALMPVAMLDDDPAKHKLRVRGVPVRGGREALADVADETGAEQLVIAIPSADGLLFREIGALGADAGLRVSVLPAVEDLLNGAPTVADVRPLDVRDLLGRREIRTDLDQIAHSVTGRRVLVTGAGGSIGSELCRQLHQLAPAQLVMIDRDESALHAVQLALEGRAMLDNRNLVVADVRDRERLYQVFDEHRPEVVFHAAALKHLPLLEMHPTEGVKTNIVGTQYLLDMAEHFAIERFVNVSTDKAADPTSVLGYTKRIAERLTAATAERAEGTFVSVRFGNVLGSRGSVLTAFTEQIAAGGPVTVTDAEVTRYFMTVEEAVQLVIQAGAIGRDGEALVLDMGEPVRIDSVARQLIANADRRIRIEYTGLRPGEKLHEVLFGADEVGATLFHPMVSHVSVPPLDLEGLDLARGDDAEVLRRLQVLCGAIADASQVAAEMLGRFAGGGSALRERRSA